MRCKNPATLAILGLCLLFKPMFVAAADTRAAEESRLETLTALRGLRTETGYVEALQEYLDALLPLSAKYPVLEPILSDTAISSQILRQAWLLRDESAAAPALSSALAPTPVATAPTIAFTAANVAAVGCGQPGNRPAFVVVRVGRDTPIRIPQGGTFSVGTRHWELTRVSRTGEDTIVALLTRADGKTLRVEDQIGHFNATDCPWGAKP